MPKITSHPGVTMFPRGQRFRVSWKDPVTQKVVFSTLDPALNTEPARLRWLKEKSKALGRQRAAIESGEVVPITWPSLADAIAAYFTAWQEQLRPKTLTAYRDAADALLAWAATVKIERADALTKAKLFIFRATRVTARKRVPVAGGKRYEYREIGKPRSARTVNRELRGLATVLEWLRTQSQVALSRDDIHDALAPQKVGERELPAPIARERIREILETCREHEPRLFPYLVTLLLTGMRAAECLALRWKQIDFANKHIMLKPSDTKTKRGRRVDLAISPALMAIFETLPRTRPRLFAMSATNTAAARKRLIKRLDDNWTFQECRETCASYLCSAPWYGPFKSGKRLGHSTTVADRLYADSITVDPTARNLETAMGIDDLIVSR